MTPRKRQQKVEERHGSVNFSASALLVGVVACGAAVRGPVEAGGAAGGGRAADSAAVVWRTRVGPSLPGPLTPAGPVLIAGTGHGVVVALAAATGEKLWHRRLQGSITAGVSGAGETLYVAGEDREGRASGLRVRDGHRIWQRGVGSARHAPLVRDGTVLLATEDGLLHAIDAAAGTERWRTRLGAAAAAPPVAWRDRILVATPDSVLVLEAASGEIVARTALPGWPSAPALLWRDRLYLPLHAGEVAVYDPGAGRVLRRARVQAPVLAAPVAGPEGEVYVLTTAAELWRLRDEGALAEPVARPGGAARGSLALVGDRALVGRLDGTLLDLRLDGSVVWEERLGDSIVAPAVVADGAIYVPLLRGVVVKLGRRP